ncbi:MAG: hypothetical protein HOO01_07525, partial [Cellvibrionales bacterium]|nr:hypothetical protein [Cellvibrionales bacterium]
MKDVRALAAKALARVISQGESFSADIDALSNTQSSNNAKTHDNTDVDNKDRAFYRELCFGTLRHFHRLD